MQFHKLFLVVAVNIRDTNLQLQDTNILNLQETDKDNKYAISK